MDTFGISAGHSSSLRTAEFAREYCVKHPAATARSGYDDDKSQGIVKAGRPLGAWIDLLVISVLMLADVRRCFVQTTVPIGDIIQDAMVLRVYPLLLLLVSLHIIAKLVRNAGPHVRFHHVRKVPRRARLHGIGHIEPVSRSAWAGGISRLFYYTIVHLGHGWLKGSG